MLVDRPTAPAALRWRALIWAVGVLGIGIIVLATQQLLAEPAAADIPGVVDTTVGGAAATVDRVAETAPVSVGRRPAQAPVLAPAADPHQVKPLGPPVVEAAAPGVDAASPVLAPVVEAAAPLVAPVAEVATPVVAPVVEEIGRAA